MRSKHSSETILVDFQCLTFVLTTILSCCIPEPRPGLHSQLFTISCILFNESAISKQYYHQIGNARNIIRLCLLSFLPTCL